MRRPPRARGEHLLSWSLLARAYLFLGGLEALSAMTAFFLCCPVWAGTMARRWPIRLTAIIRRRRPAGWPSSWRRWSMSSFAAIPRYRHWQFSLRENRLLLSGLMLEAVLIVLIVYTPWGNRLFATAPPPASIWLVVVPFAPALGVLEEGRKQLLRRWAGTTSS
ncbi:cation transporting ATPase C-terminal domain-containing protein [Paludibacterium denitrificans]|uniref:cation transporting ATPase C-terminal domain-containing protein n=1 Tax=Paludibacterium denitrificans TaxID=2675226 RepID=UPI001E4F44C3|nr:cation-translocating P-type ATPase C-terminal domain-containing protein [Paludibacterium denitrificans]